MIWVMQHLKKLLNQLFVLPPGAPDFRALKRAILCCVVFAAVSLNVVTATASELDDAARQAAARTGGRVLGVEQQQRGDRIVYLVRVLLEDGRVKLVEVSGRPPNARR